MANASGPANPPMLTCWKDIGRYLGKSARTVQRWERELGLPVRRPTGSTGKSSVLADPRELDAWLALHWTVRDGEGRPEPPRLALDPTMLIRDLNEKLQTAHSLKAELLDLRMQHKQLTHELSNALNRLAENFRISAPAEAPQPSRTSKAATSRKQPPRRGRT